MENCAHHPNEKTDQGRPTPASVRHVGDEAGTDIEEMNADKAHLPEVLLDLRGWLETLRPKLCWLTLLPPKSFRFSTARITLASTHAVAGKIQSRLGVCRPHRGECA